MKIPNINGWTALVVIAALGGIIYMVHFKVEVTTFGLAATAMLAVMSQLGKLFHFGETPKDDPPPPPPKGPSVKEPDAGDPGALKRHPYREPATASASAIRPPKLPPKIAPGPIAISERGWFSPAWIAFGALSMVVLSACGLLSPKSVVDAVLSVSDLACLETGKGSRTDDPDAAAIACELAKDPVIRNVVRNLVGQRVAAKRAGFVWRPVAISSDGDAAANDNGIVETVAKDAGR